MANLSDLVNLVSKNAPLVGSLLGSPLSGLGVSWLASLFGAKNNDIDDIISKITQDSDAYLKLKTLENQHQEELLKISLAEYQADIDDRKSARERQVSLKDAVPTILAIGFLLNYAAIQFYCVTHPSNAIDVISARFQDILIMIMSYFFGSSHSMSSTSSFGNSAKSS